LALSSYTFKQSLHEITNLTQKRKKLNSKNSKICYPKKKSKSSEPQYSKLKATFSFIVYTRVKCTCVSCVLVQARCECDIIIIYDAIKLSSNTIWSANTGSL